MLTITHSHGFFSNCSVRLHKIIEYYNKYNKLPDRIDCSKQFQWYKPINYKKGSLIDEYFYENKDILIDLPRPIDYSEKYQYKNYKELDYIKIIPFIHRYFPITPQIQQEINYIEEKFKLKDNYNNICVLFHRGNNKSIETKLCPYEETLKQAKKILESNPNIFFLLQSDETYFIEYMTRHLPRTFYLKGEIRHIHKKQTSVDIINNKDTNFIFSKKYLAITHIMSKCKYIICGSGNCSIWIALFRENADNIIQYFNGVWY
jgi:hypothetical protein